MEIPVSDLRPGMIIMSTCAGSPKPPTLPMFVYDILPQSGKFRVEEYKVLEKPQKNQYGNTLLCEHVNASIFPLDARVTIADADDSRGLYQEHFRKFPSSIILALRSNLFFPMTIGSDPEIFAVNRKWCVIPAFKFLPSKSKSLFHEARPHCHAFYDGFQGEWTTPAGVYCLGILTDCVRYGMQLVQRAARNYDKNATLVTSNVLDIGKLDPKIDPRHYELGCEPSKNAYGEEPVRLADPASLRFRFAGWHMHIQAKWTSGYLTSSEGIHGVRYQTAVTEKNAPSIIRMMDRILGVALVSFSEGMTDPRRRQYYGRAGEYRLGETLEYRVPDPSIGCHPATFNLFWDIGRKAFLLGLKGLDFIWDTTDEETRECINGGDVKLARQILHRNAKVLRDIIIMSYMYPDGQEIADQGMKAIMQGAKAVLANPEAIEDNWYLNDPRQLDWALETSGHKKVDQRWGTYALALKHDVDLEKIPGMRVSALCDKLEIPYVS